MNKTRFNISVAYPKFKKLPELPPAVGIVTLSRPQKCNLSLPISLFEFTGIDLAGNVSVGTYEGQIIVWQGASQCMITKPWESLVLLHTPSIPAGIERDNFAVVYGKGYFIICNAETAQKVMPGAELKEFVMPQKLSVEDIIRVDETLKWNSKEKFAWADVSVQQVTRTSIIPTKLLVLAGFKFGSRVTATRFKDGAEFSICTDGSSTHELQEKKWGNVKNAHMRLYVGRMMISMDDLTHVRVIAYPGRVRVVRLDHPRGSVLPASGHLSKKRTAPLGIDTASADEYIDDKKNTSFYELKDHQTRLQIQGAWLRTWGFIPGAKYRVEKDPAFSRQAMAVLDPEGPCTVTTLSGNTPKLYAPRSVLEVIRSPLIQVMGMPGRLQFRSDIRGNPAKPVRKAAKAGKSVKPVVKATKAVKAAK